MTAAMVSPGPGLTNRAFSALDRLGACPGERGHRGRMLTLSIDDLNIWRVSNDQSDELLSVISELFTPAPVTPDSTLDELEATSLHLLRLMSSLQHRYNITLDVVDMFTVENVGDLIRLVEERAASGGLAPQ